ncbi:MAG: DUF3782 domain-containing protein [Chromatiaceae bacterium]|nr:DUF3782 domain-containing protein [Chromatiaceae bacterium]MCF8015136.1 DUF3782 domain-containing protein [Chromatiaceae bacterium]
MATSAEDIWALFQETDRKIQDSDARLTQRFEETDRQLKESDARLTQRFEETDRLIQEADARLTQRFEQTDHKIRALSELIGRQGNRLGEFVQEMVRPAVVGLLRERGLPVHQVAPNLSAYDDNGQLLAEIDLLALNAQVAVAVECKSHLSIDDVNDHLDRLAAFKHCFPQYQTYQLLGAVAGMVVPDQVGRFAYRKGLFVLAQSGNAIEIRNDSRFQPKTW